MDNYKLNCAMRKGGGGKAEHTSKRPGRRLGVEEVFPEEVTPKLGCERWVMSHR